MPVLTFTTEVDDELAAAILATERLSFDLATIFGGKDGSGPEIVDYLPLTLVMVEHDDLRVQEFSTEIATDEEEAAADAEDCICCPRCDVDDHRSDCPQWGA